MYKRYELDTKIGKYQVHGGRSRSRGVCASFQSAGASGACEGAKRKQKRGALPPDEKELERTMLCTERQELHSAILPF